MADIFLSYASHDLKAIRPLVRALEQEGWSVFWDREIPLGKTWRELLDQEMSTARCVIVVWTETSVHRRWVLEEADEGLGRGILIPIFMDRVAAPRGFREVQGATLFNWKGKSDDKEFVRLCGACREVLGAPGQHKPEVSKRKKRRLGGVSRFKWMAVALGLVLATAGSWFWYQTAERQPDPTDAPAKEPVPKADPLTAALQYQEACNSGSAQDCNNLGSLYSAGRGVAKDPLRAATLYQKACDGKITEGCMNLAALYEEGRGVAKDDERAATLYQQVCDEGVASGCGRLELLNQRRQRQANEPTGTTTGARAAEPTGRTPTSQATKWAQLRITVSPWGDVWINGKREQRAPRELSLKPGKYTISVGQGSPAKSRVIRLKPGEQRAEHFDLSH